MQEKQWANKIREKILEKERVVAERSRGKVPYMTVNGRFDDWTDRNICWWTNGFYGGLMWLLHCTSKEELFREAAEEIEEKLDRNLMDYAGMDHDSGFKWSITSVVNYKLYGKEASKNRALLAAANLAGRYNLAGAFIRAWNDPEGERAGWAIIDCLMNLPLLYWASEETHDPRFRHIAKSHADTVLREFQREDGSVWHIMRFDPETGKRVGPLGGQGMDENSSWTRGQSWALYGLALSYKYTKEERYLEGSRRVAQSIIREMRDREFMPVDFRQPKEIPWEDSTAAAIMACGFLELEQYAPQEEKTVYHKMAVRLIRTLAEHRCDFSQETDNLLVKCTAAYHDEEHDFTIIYGDYYFTQAVLLLCGEEVLTM